MSFVDCCWPESLHSTFYFDSEFQRLKLQEFLIFNLFLKCLFVLTKGNFTMFLSTGSESLPRDSLLNTWSFRSWGTSGMLILWAHFLKYAVFLHGIVPAQHFPESIFFPFWAVCFCQQVCALPLYWLWKVRGKKWTVNYLLTILILFLVVMHDYHLQLFLMTWEKYGDMALVKKLSLKLHETGIALASNFKGCILSHPQHNWCDLYLMHQNQIFTPVSKFAQLAI